MNTIPPHLSLRKPALWSNAWPGDRVYVITSDQTIYVSNDALAATPTFTNYALPNPTTNNASITSIKSAPNVLYAVLNTKVYRSADNGATWADVSLNLPSINWVKIIPDEYFSSNELIFVAGNNTVYYKKTGQANWTLFSTGLPARTNMVDFSVYDDGTNQSILRVTEYGRGMWEVPMTSLRAVIANFTSPNAYPCVGGSVTFNDQSAGNITTWTWTFPGGTPATSTLQNPTVVYNVAGNYDVTLQVSDGVTSNTLTKTYFVNTLGSGLPLNEGFESTVFPPTGFTAVDDGADGVGWQRNTSVGGFGTSTNTFGAIDKAANTVGRIHIRDLDLIPVI